MATYLELLMPRELTARQIRLPGELLGSAVHDPDTTADVTLSGTHQNVGAQLQFTSDRTGTVLVSLVVYVDKHQRRGGAGGPACKPAW